MSLHDMSVAEDDHCSIASGRLTDDLSLAQTWRRMMIARVCRAKVRWPQCRCEKDNSQTDKSNPREASNCDESTQQSSGGSVGLRGERRGGVQLLLKLLPGAPRLTTSTPDDRRALAKRQHDEP
jgi:hypothetical protein